MEREGFSICESCLGRQMSKNSVLKGLSIRRFADNLEETSAIALVRKESFTEFVSRERNEKLGVICIQVVMKRRFRD
jgi:hypothetical protein